MPKKFTVEERRRMLERLEYGATHTDLKSEFRIKDSRTLEKQLTQAREEQALRGAKTEIIKENLRDHLSEIRSLLETWNTSVKSPSPPSFARYSLSATEQVEQSRLFDGVRGHLPFPELWRNYQAFKLKWDDYLTTCEKIHRRIVDNAKEKWGLGLLEKNEQRPGLMTFFSWEMLERVIKVDAGDSQAGTPHYEAAPLNPQTPDLEYLGCGGQVILYSNQALRYAEDHRSMIAEWVRSEEVADLVRLIAELRDLEKRIHDIVEDILLRRDYILYTCRLCPGGARLGLK